MNETPSQREPADDKARLRDIGERADEAWTIALVALIGVLYLQMSWIGLGIGVVLFIALALRKGLKRGRD